MVHVLDIDSYLFTVLLEYAYGRSAFPAKSDLYKVRLSVCLEIE